MKDIIDKLKEFKAADDSAKEMEDTIKQVIKIIESIKEYAQNHIDSYTEDIADYIDDDRIGNRHIIGELKEYREHWRDIIRIMNNEKTYMDW